MTRSLLKFFSFTFIVSWIFWAAAAFAWSAAPGSGPQPAAFSGALFLLGTITPSLVALALTARAGGRFGTLALLRRVVQFPQDARWYVFAAAYMAAVKLIMAFIHRFATGAWPEFGQTPFFLIAAAILISTPVQAGEEIGWRGFALPRLATRFGFPLASLILGVIWACWHLPFFFISGSDNYGQSFPVYLLAVTAISVTMTWLYLRTNGSLFLMMLMHAAINNTAGIVRSGVSYGTNPFTLRPSLTAWLTAVVLCVGATYFLVRMIRTDSLGDTKTNTQA